MKKLLTLTTLGGFIGVTMPNVVACNTKQKNDSLYKRELKKVIDHSDVILENDRGKSEKWTKLAPLERVNLNSKEVYFASNSKDEDYQKSRNDLFEAINIYQDPTFEDAKEALKDYIALVEINISTTGQYPPTPKTAKALKKSLVKAKKMLNTESDKSVLYIQRDILRYWLYQYIWEVVNGGK